MANFRLLKLAVHAFRPEPISAKHSSLASKPCATPAVVPKRALVHSHPLQQNIRLWPLHHLNAHHLFDEIPHRNYINLIIEHNRSGRNHEAINLFLAVFRAGLPVTVPVLTSVVKACGTLCDQVAGRQVHCQCVKSGLGEDVSVGSSLVSMYMKTEGLVEGRRVFDELRETSVVTWTAIISGYLQNGATEKAVELFCKMCREGVRPNDFTYAAIITAHPCISVFQVHAHVIKTNYERSPSAGISLVSAYVKIGNVPEAEKVLQTIDDKETRSWNAVLAGYTHIEDAVGAIRIFLQLTRNGFRPDKFTLSSIITACSAPSGTLEQGKQFHACAVKLMLDSTLYVSSALVTMYSKMGNLESANEAFKRQGERNVILWNSMISGYMLNGRIEKGVKLFCKMSREGLRPDKFTLSSIIAACAAPSATVDLGKQFHAYSIKLGLNNELSPSNALVTMYANMGNLESANEVFKRQGERNVISWSSMISGYAQYGQGNKALELFEEMRRQNLEVNGITFLVVISACAHACLVDEGKRYFDMMVQDYHINPTMEHYTCMVGLYSRAGNFEMAMDLINNMPFSADANVWRAILGACPVYLNLELAKFSAEKIISLQPKDSFAYSTLANIYAAAGNWQERDEVVRLAKERKVQRLPGFSWIEV
ncbi:pentatricopeptide repeat-containing protein At2g27610-like [Argentina anserina]|uniref:pentatricopeptide repeat-containing protein At2g27610-like n=1 Tax=Argentina anserina TaxID=57926 RepID=UPI002176247B|nr:pentatricopeptide repeat-containing protein At2g27610-like [Potentilla anserina]